MQMVLNAKSTRHTKSFKGGCDLTLPKTYIHNNGSKYMEFVKTSLCKSSFDKIVKKAQKMMASMHWVGIDDTVDIDNFDDVQLVDLSDEDCKLNVFITIILHCTEIYEQSVLWNMADTCITVATKYPLSMSNSFSTKFTTFAICYPLHFVLCWK